MSIEIKKNKELKLDIPEFICDGSLDENLNKYDMLKNLNGFKFTAIIGKPGSGKTSLITAFLTGKKDKKVFRKVFNNIFFVFYYNMFADYDYLSLYLKHNHVFHH